MSFHTIIEALNQDLRNENKHHRFYLQCGFTLTGPARLWLGPWLKAQAAEELGHIEQFASKIVALGGVPTVEMHPFPTNLTSFEQVMSEAIAMEREVVSNYHARLTLTGDFSRATGGNYDLVLFYEEQLEDSQGDLDEMVKLMGTMR